MEIHKNGIGLPIIALGFDLAPVLIVFLGSIIRGFTAFTLLSLVLLPVAGLVTGVLSLSLGKGKICRIGKILAIIAVSLPAAFVLCIVVIFIGAETGVIALM